MAPLQFMIVTATLYFFIGPSCLGGLALILLFIPIQGLPISLILANYKLIFLRNNSSFCDQRQLYQLYIVWFLLIRFNGESIL